MARTIALLLCAACLRAQSADATLTQTLIAEIRALRQDLEATNITSQRVQIALYRLQSQTAVVNTAEQRLDAARTRRAEIENVQRSLAMQVQQGEETLRTGDVAQQKMLREELSRVKAGLESVSAELAARRGAESEAESQLRAERARLVDLQSLLDRLDKALDELARPKR
jgi:hypothetical protein